MLTPIELAKCRLQIQTGKVGDTSTQKYKVYIIYNNHFLFFFFFLVLCFMFYFFFWFYVLCFMFSISHVIFAEPNALPDGHVP